jgi:hypothetical protein
MYMESWDKWPWMTIPWFKINQHSQWLPGTLSIVVVEKSNIKLIQTVYICIYIYIIYVYKIPFHEYPIAVTLIFDPASSLSIFPNNGISPLPKRTPSNSPSGRVLGWLPRESGHMLLVGIEWDDFSD